ncbi:MAG: hypothetical protein N2Z70_04780, partial [Bdellovibrionaceae bacterium]|nr:hypothetical protein [Pseudobdellovibrionaceae bacterium]
MESYTMAKKIYEESLRTKDSVDLRRSQFFEARERVKRLHGELRAWGIKSEYVVLDEKIKNLMKDINESSDVPRGTGH